MTKWTGAKTRLINKIFKRGSVYYDRDLSDTALELLNDKYIQSTKFGFGNYELTQKGKDKAIELKRIGVKR